MSPKKDEYMRGYGDGFKDGMIAPHEPKNEPTRWSRDEVKRVARRVVDLWRNGGDIEVIENSDVLVGNIEFAILAAIEAHQHHSQSRTVGERDR